MNCIYHSKVDSGLRLHDGFSTVGEFQNDIFFQPKVIVDFGAVIRPHVINEQFVVFGRRRRLLARLLKAFGERKEKEECSADEEQCAADVQRNLV